jgi:hypothetical protein
MCLCKGCEYVDITTWADTPKYESVLFCQCCGGERLIQYSFNLSNCPNRR